MNGSLAQLEEHLVYTERVGSSNLSTPTNQKPPLRWFFCWFGSFGENSREREFAFADFRRTGVRRRLFIKQCHRSKSVI